MLFFSLSLAGSKKFKFPTGVDFFVLFCSSAFFGAVVRLLLLLVPVRLFDIDQTNQPDFHFHSNSLGKKCMKAKKGKNIEAELALFKIKGKKVSVNNV